MMPRMEKPALHSKWAITPGGDAKGGWMVDIHDGDRLETYSPKADTVEQAREAAIAAHTGKYFAEVGGEASAQQAAMDAARASRAADKALEKAGDEAPAAKPPAPKP